MNIKNSLCAGLLLAVLTLPSLAANKVDPSTLDGKVLFGYQGWFDCPMESVPGSKWSHWSRGVPSAETLSIDMYPDLSEFAPADLCAIPGMTIGNKPAYLFSAKNANVVLRHFTWMQNYGLDGVLVQRFVGDIAARRAGGDIVLKNIMAAAAKTGRTFAIEYDISGGRKDAFYRILQDDWKYLVDDLKITAQPNYLYHKGKPVLSIWGMGLGDVAHQPEDAATATTIVKWFETGAAPAYRVTYIGGTPARWRTLSGDSRKDPAWPGAYRAMDVVQPWTVGRYKDTASVEVWKTDVLAPDNKQLQEAGQLYMPVIFPGFSWYNLQRSNPERKSPQNQTPRNRGEFLWRQAYNAKTSGATMLKIAMFDEVNEGTAMFKIASHRKDAPDQGYWLTLDADGADLPSDWYLRLAGEITRMFHGELEPSPDLPETPGGPAPQPADAQHVTKPHASVVDVARRQATLASTTDPLLRKTIKGLASCVATPAVAAPTGRIIIPNHYLQGSNGPTNPAEGAATRVYGMFENRVTAGMNQYVATGSHAEAACALAQLDEWAQGHALLNYDRKESQQGWMQVEWTLSAVGTAASVLVNDATLDAARQQRVIAWLDTSSHKDISFEKPTDTGNNHHYWRALNATAIGVLAADDELFRFGIETYKQAINEVDANGAFPKEMARHENATHYQAFAIQPLILIAEFAARQGIDLYSYEAHGRTLRDAIVFLGRAAGDPSLITPYTHDAQAPVRLGEFAALAFYTARFGVEGLPPAIVNALKAPTVATRIGGNTTILAQPAN